MTQPILPDAWTEVLDGGLALEGPSPRRIHVKVGSCTKGTVGEIVTITDDAQIAEKLGDGPLAERLNESWACGARYMYAMRADTSSPGDFGSPVKVGDGSGDMTVGGTPLNDYEAVVKIVAEGELGVATFKYSLDGGDNYSPVYAVPVAGEYTIPDTGITLTFENDALDAENSFHVDDTYSFTVNGPAMTVADLTNVDETGALDLLFKSSKSFNFVHICGGVSKAICDVLGTLADEQEAKEKLIFFVTETRKPTDGETQDAYVTSVAEDFADFVQERVSPVASYAEVQHPRKNEIKQRNLAAHACGMISQAEIGQSIAEVEVFPIPLVQSLWIEDELLIKDLDDGHFITARTYHNYPGFYFTEGRTKAAPTSDFQYLEFLMVMDEVRRRVRQIAISKGHKRVRLQPGGDLTEAVRKQLEAELGDPVSKMEGVSFSEGRLTIPEGQNVASTGQVSYNVAILPFGIMRWLKGTFGFSLLTGESV